MENKSFTAAAPNYSKKVCQIGGEQPVYCRTYYFNNILRECQKLLLELIHCKGGKVAFLTASGTGAMNTAIINLISPEDKVLVINGGSFGKRWEDLCSYYNLKYNIFKVEFGKNLSLADLEKSIVRYKSTVILVQHNETSSMQLHPIKEIGKLCKKYNIKLVVDAISSFTIDEYQMDEYNVYATVISMNKGIGTYPGLSGVVLSKNVEIYRSSDYYFDLSKYLSDSKDISLPFTPNTPFTPNIVSIKQLYNQLKYFKKVGLNSVIKKINNRANNFRALIKDLPLVIAAETLSNCGTTLYTDRNDVKELFEKLQTKRIYFTPLGGVEGKKLSIGHIGEQTLKDNGILVKELKNWLNGGKL